MRREPPILLHFCRSTAASPRRLFKFPLRSALLLPRRFITEELLYNASRSRLMSGERHDVSCHF